jgi:hypothetical protein
LPPTQWHCCGNVGSTCNLTGNTIVGQPYCCASPQDPNWDLTSEGHQPQIEECQPLPGATYGICCLVSNVQCSKDSDCCSNFCSPTSHTCSSICQ